MKRESSFILEVKLEATVPIYDKMIVFSGKFTKENIPFPAKGLVESFISRGRCSSLTLLFDIILCRKRYT